MKKIVLLRMAKVFGIKKTVLLDGQMSILPKGYKRSDKSR